MEPRVGWLCSDCALLRREALDQVGVLDEDYFIYGDEADLQYRLQKPGRRKTVLEIGIRHWRPHNAT